MCYDDEMEKYLITLDDTHAFAEEALQFAEQASVGSKTATIIGLWGNLGAGKTTFTQQLAEILGIKEDITSPTFVIEKIYATGHPAFAHLIHIDAYRLDSGKELQTLGWDKIAADPKNLIVIEWPDRVLDILPKKIIKIALEIDGNGRKARIG